MAVFDRLNNWAQGAFTIDPDATPEQLQRKRAAMQRATSSRRPQYVEEGLAELAKGIVFGIKRRRMDRFEADKRREASEQFKGAMGGPLTMIGMNPSWGQQPKAPDPLSEVNEEFGTNFTPEDVQNRPELATFVQERSAAPANYTPGNRESFIQAMMPHAQRVSQRTGLDPRLVIAQAAQETGWGKHAPNNNFFGIKSHGRKGGGSFATVEYVNGKPVTIQDSFRGYGGMGESADGYAEFLLENPRYRHMLAAGNLDGQLAALGRSGYATDPNYANSVGAIARSIQMGGGAPAAPSAPSVATPAYTGPSVRELQSALMNPWLSPSEKQVASSMLQQAMQAQDPMRQMQMQQEQIGLQKSQLELDGMQNPPAPERRVVEGADGYKYYQDNGERVLPGVEMPVESEAPSAFRALEERARAAGLEPGSPEYQQFMINGGADRGMSFRVGADGSVEMQQGGATATARKATADEAKSAGFLLRAEQSNGILDGLDQEGTSFWGRLREKVPGGNYQQSPEYQQFEQARRDFVNSVLRRESGAVISDQEFDNADRQYFPQPGDSAAVIEQKRRNRQAALEGLRIGAGPVAPQPSSASPYESFDTFKSDPSVLEAAREAGVTPQEMWDMLQGGE